MAQFVAQLVKLGSCFPSIVIEHRIATRTGEALPLTGTDQIKLILVFRCDSIVKHGTRHGVLIAIFVKALRVNFNFLFARYHAVKAFKVERGACFH